MFNRAIIAACFGLWAMLGAAARADTPIYYTHEGLAIRGYDTVAYFSTGQPERGQADFAVMWKGAVWWFTSADNLQRFEADPRAYAPQFGGYCAFSVSQGHISTGDPGAWEIVDGRLYLTNSPAVHRLWARDKGRNIVQGQQNWPTVLGR